MPNKSLGQYWLFDKPSLDLVIMAANLNNQDTVLEIGPGQGSLTEKLIDNSKKVTAIELDKELINKLKGKFISEKLELINEDILSFDLSRIDGPYKVVANIPYYLTSKLIRKLLTSQNKPTRITLLVQKEVAVRLAAKPGRMSTLSISAQLYSEVKLHEVIKAEKFEPIPKVDSQIVSLNLYKAPIINVDEQRFMQLVKHGFSNRRKKLSNSMSGGIGIEREKIEVVLDKLKLNRNTRAQDLALSDWEKLYNLLSAYV